MLTVDLRKFQTLPKYDELLELQKDAKRVIRQAERLMELRPKFADDYKKQLSEVMHVLNEMADKATESKPRQAHAY